AVDDERGADHADAEDALGRRRPVVGQLLREDHLLDVAGAEATVRLRPGRRDPALLGQLPVKPALLLEVLGGGSRVALGVDRCQLLVQETAQLSPERLLPLAEREVQTSPPSCGPPILPSSFPPWAP